MISQRPTHHGADTVASLTVPNDARLPQSSTISDNGLPDNVAIPEEKRVPFDGKIAHLAEITETAVNGGEPEFSQVEIIAEAEDIVTTILHIEDDVSLNPWTFHMFLIGKPGVTQFYRYRHR